MKQAREYYGETQAQFGKRFGFESPTAISLIESGQRDMPGAIAYWLVAEFKLLPKRVELCDRCSGQGFVIALASLTEDERAFLAQNKDKLQGPTYNVAGNSEMLGEV